MKEVVGVTDEITLGLVRLARPHGAPIVAGRVAAGEERRRRRGWTAVDLLSTASAIPQLHQWCASISRSVVAQEPNPR
jgi:hypothetical protein